MLTLASVVTLLVYLNAFSATCVKVTNSYNADTSTSMDNMVHQQSHVAFLDVPFTGGKTVRNILQRLGRQERRTFVTSTDSYPRGFSFYVSDLGDVISNRPKRDVKSSPKDDYFKWPYNIKFENPFECFQFLSKSNDTKLIGIVRSPFEQFISTISFLEPDYIFKINSSKPIETFLENPAIYEPKAISKSWTNNRMAFEFGFPFKFFHEYNHEEVQVCLKALDKSFHLVFIREYFDESLIFMKRLLNLRFIDILYINDFQRPSKEYLPSFTGSYLHRQYFKLDYDLYYFFYEKLRRQIIKEGERFEAELKHFQAVRKQLKAYCTGDANTDLFIPGSHWNEPFTVTTAKCEDMMREDIDFS